MAQRSPFAKLFDPNARKDQDLQKIRDRIYYFAWSRDRRDEAKLDWVVSEYGVNRNVPQRWIDEAPSGKKRDRIDALPCWLHLVNKQISADFTRFIYSVNDLDILVDLKGDNTKPNEAKLDRIADRLHNANFQRYTRSARVRVHFPDKYPFQKLPAFNQLALDNIAIALDGFQQLKRLSVRVVPMQGPETYELRLATFPFYPMSMTNWSIRILNSSTYNWDVVGGEQLHHLNLAWELFQETGSLDVSVHAPGDTEKQTTQVDQVSGANGALGAPKKLVVDQKKNGSQKRKNRKLKAHSAVTAPSALKTTSEVPSDDTSLRSSTLSLDPSKGLPSMSVLGQDSGSGAEPSQTIVSIFGAPDPVPAGHDAARDADQSSPTATTKPRTASGVKQDSASELHGESVEADSTAGQRIRPEDSIETAPEERVNLEKSREISPSSSAPSSVTLGRDQSEDETAILNTVEDTPLVETTMRGSGADSEKPVQKKRRNRKKSKKTKLTDMAGIPSNDDSGQQTPLEADDNDGPIFISTLDAQRIIQMNDNSDGIILNGNRGFPLAEIVELTRFAGDERLLRYRRANGRRGVIYATPDVERLLRQKERVAAQETERKAEKMRTKEKRKTKKAKEVMIRRKGASDGLRRRVEDMKQMAGSKQGSELRKRFSEITGDCHKTEGFASHNSSEDFDSSDDGTSSLEDDQTPPEQAEDPRRDLSIQHERVDTSSVSSGRQSSSSANSPRIRIPLPANVLMFSVEDNPGEGGAKVEHQDFDEPGRAGIGYNSKPTSPKSHDQDQRTMAGFAGHQDQQMDGQTLVEELEDSDDCASIVPNYGDEGPLSISDDESQSHAA